jgi:cell division protein FtsB
MLLGTRDQWRLRVSLSRSGSPPCHDRPMADPRVSRRVSTTGRLAVLVAVIVLLGTTLSVPIRNWFGQRAQIAALEAELESLTLSVAELEILKERWEDPAFISAEARRRLHFVYPGEVGFITIGETVTTESEGPQPLAEHPWHITLWQTVEAIDRGTEPD